MKTKLLIVLSAIIFLSSCASKEVKKEHEEHEEHAPEGMVVLNQKQQEALNLKLGGFEMRNLTTVIKTNGQLEVPPSSTAEVTAIIGGHVKRIRVFQGDKVRKGQVLAILEHPDYIKIQEDFAETSHKLDFLKLELNRQKELFDNNVGAGRDLQKTKSEYNIAKSKFEGLKSRLQLLNISSDNVLSGKISNTIAIYSPLNGYVNEVKIKLGTFVDPKDILFEIMDNSEIHADFMVYEKDVHLIKEGQRIHFTVSNMPDKEFIATIFAVGREFDPKTRALHIHAKLDKKVKGLIPGMYITGHIHTDKRMTRTLPNDAIVVDGTKSFIFVLENHEDEKHDIEGDHDKNDHIENDEHNHAEGRHGDDSHDDGAKAFKMVEIITGQSDEGYTEVKLIEPMAEEAKIVLNSAYYLLADMNKEETEHDH